MNFLWYVELLWLLITACSGEPFFCPNVWWFGKDCVSLRREGVQVYFKSNTNMVIWIFVILALMWLAWFIITNSQRVTTIETPPDTGIRIVATHPYHNEYIRLEVQSKTGRYCRCDIAGIRYCGNLSNYVGEFTGWLVAEPDNPHDPNAIKITHADGKKVGYIPRNYDGDEIRFNRQFPCPCQCFIARGDNGYYGICAIAK